MKFIKGLFLAISLCSVLTISVGCTQETTVYELQDEKNQGDIPKTPDSEEDSKEHTVKTAESSEQSMVDADTEGRSAEVVVYICGAVASPGVYTLPDGSRMYELIEAAGGLLEEADNRVLNQAEVLRDGQQVVVYTKEEAVDLPVPDSGAGKSGSNGKKVNLNTARAEELMTLSGIGEARAQAIIAYREQHGGFRSIEEIMKIEGIKEKLFEKIREQIEI